MGRKGNGDNQLTVFMNPLTVCKSKYGRIANRDWLRLEKQKVERLTGREVIEVEREDEDGLKVALFYKEFDK